MRSLKRSGLQSLEYFDLKDLEANPKDPELIQELDGIIDRYIQRASGLDGGGGITTAR